MELVLKPRQSGRFLQMCLQVKDMLEQGQSVFIPCEDENDSIVDRYKATFIQIGLELSTLEFKRSYKQGKLMLHNVFDIDTNSIEPIYSIPYNERKRFTGYTVSQKLNSQTT